MIKPGKQINVAVLVYPHVEMIDMVCPLDCFNKVNYFITAGQGGNTPRYNIYTVAEVPGPIYSQEGLVQIIPKYAIYNCPEPDIIVVPGITLGPTPNNERNFGIASLPVLEWIVKMNSQGKEILAVCIGVFHLAAAGLLGGRYATTHYQCVDMLADYKPVPPFSQTQPIKPVKNIKYVDSADNIVTAGGLTCGIAGALHIIEKFDGNVTAQNAADILVFNRDAPLPPNTLTLPYDLP